VEHALVRAGVPSGPGTVADARRAFVTFPALVDSLNEMVEPDGSLKASTFADLYRNHAREVYRFALYLSGDPALAEDIVSETFLRVWDSAVTVRMETVRGYLFTIARNLFLQDLRR
jgi:DNA-directed RNA polymerase specialized sigma24 family protein